MKNNDELPKELKRIAHEGGTEAPFTGKYWNETKEGIYKCAICGNQLFKSNTKFETTIPGLAGWPSFQEAIPGSIEFREDDTAEMNRTEVVCKKCGAHLGHLFNENIDSKTGKHYCINSVCLDLEPDK